MNICGFCYYFGLFVSVGLLGFWCGFAGSLVGGYIYALAFVLICSGAITVSLCCLLGCVLGERLGCFGGDVAVFV